LTLQQERPDLLEKLKSEQQRISPGWCEARYLRTLPWLKAHSASEHEYILLWVFAVVDQQFGFALDVAREVRVTFSDTGLSDRLVSVTAGLLSESRRANSSSNTNRRLVLSRAWAFLRRRLAG
jgi:hypothetical protein